MKPSSTHASAFWQIFSLELRLLRREPALWIVAILFLALVSYALSNAMTQVRAQALAQARIADADLHARQAQLQYLQRILAGTDAPKPFENPANPAVMASGYGATHATLPPGPLAPVALGQSDLYPSQFKVTHHSRAVFMNPSDIESPWYLMSGHFDLAFVLVYVMPLMIFVLSYNILSGEREAGTLRLLMSQPIRLATLLAAKLGARALVLLVPAVLVPVAVLLLAQRATGASALSADLVLWWAALVAAYALFWFALVVAVNAFGAPSATNAMVLMAAWVMAVLVVPVLLNLGVAAASPAPSRTELATRLRGLTAQAMRTHAELLSTEYKHVGQGALLAPVDGRIEIAGRALGQYRVQRDVDAAIAPELQRFDTQSAGQRRLVDLWAFLSPAALAYEGMTQLAGTGGRRHARFTAQVTDFHAQWKAFFAPRIEARIALMPDDFAQIPRFVWQDEPRSALAGHAARALAGLVFPSLLLLGLAAWRLRRFSVN